MGGSLFTPLHLIVLLIVALLLFGAKRLPEIGRSLGTGMREFKDSVTASSDKVETRSELPPPVATVPVVPPAADTAVAPVPAPAETERKAEHVS
jgi:sec-independent protein translocase protein TatA